MSSLRLLRVAGMAATLVCAAALIVGCNNAASSSPSPPPPPPSSGAMYVTDFTNQTVTVYGQTANCSCNPARQIAGSNTKLGDPIGIAVDSAGTIYVANENNSTITEYGSSSHGNVGPSFTITGLSAPIGVAVDSAKNVYVTNGNANSIQVFPQGSATPRLTISGALTGLSTPGFIALDASNDIWVANETGNSIVEFPPLSSDPGGNIAPIEAIFGPNTSIDNPQGIAFDTIGRLWVAINNEGANFDAVLVFQGVLNGDISPANAICGPSTGVNNPSGVAVNSQNTVFVVNSFTGVAGYVTDFALNNVGNLACDGPPAGAPNATVSGPAMLNPAGIALH
jgi:hypothetical protein